MPLIGYMEGVSPLAKISTALFIAAEVFLLAGIGAASLPLVGGWALAGAVVACSWWLAGPRLRVFVSAMLIVACLLLAVEEGLFFLPAAIVLFAAAATSRRARGTHRSHHTHRPGHAVH